MALATARLGAIGAWQSGILYAAYTLSSLTGATYVVKVYGARNSILMGMALYVFYVACFILATSVEAAGPAAMVGAAVGGIGGGLLWTAQGVYFSQAAEHYHAASLLESPDEHMSLSDATSYLAGIFAAIYLAMEATLELLPTLLIQAGIVSWTTIFGIYSIIAVLAGVGMLGVVADYSPTSTATITSAVNTDDKVDYSAVDAPPQATASWQQKLLAAWYLLRDDTKLKYLIGLNAAFGFSGAFVHSFVNGEVVRLVLDDDQSKYVGALSAWSAIVSSGMSLVFDAWSRRHNNGVNQQGSVQIMGCCAYLSIVLPFLLFPDLQAGPWGWGLLLLVYFMYGAGRSTFEGSLKAIFADFFPHEKEGAYSNIVLQSGLTSTVGFIVTYVGLPCQGSEDDAYCILYKDGTHHNVLILELAVAITSILAIFGYLRAAQLFDSEQKERGTID
jgi:MFS family permease